MQLGEVRVRAGVPERRIYMTILIEFGSGTFPKANVLKAWSPWWCEEVVEPLRGDLNLRSLWV
jgi:hypothetical protein